MLIYKGKYKKTIFISTLFINLLILFIFKYLGFFSITLNEILKITKINFTLPEFKLLLPIGISFYTFQSIGYLIDVYKNKIKPENNIFIFLLFVTFFPQLVAGPIERSNNLLPQFKKTKKLNYHKISTGLKLISLGLFKKIVIADNLSLLVNQVYNNLDEYRGLSLLIATVCFGIQIWGDFSGYTDIARGSAKLLGFDLIKNFKNPYFATSITDFWRRWHISLSTWFKDYIYINLGGNRKGLLRTCFNLFFIFFLCGLWHGASMNFVIWGMYFGLIISIEKIIFYLIKKYNLKIKIPFLIKNFYANILVLFGWALFRSEKLQDSIYIYKNMFVGFKNFFSLNYIFATMNQVFSNNLLEFCIALFCLLSAIFIEIISYKKGLSNFITNLSGFKRWSIYIIIITSIIMLQNSNIEEFIYFQF